ncbi:MAG: AEC family transporter [Quisquiliibacterium sp.]
MLRVLEVTLPVFALVFCGFFGQRWRLLPANAVEGLNAFVFYFAVPAMLFRVIATQPPDSFSEPLFMLGYAAAGLGVYFFVRAAARPDPATGDHAERTDGQRDAIALAMTSAHSNLGYLGIPLALELGRQHAPVMVMAILCDIVCVILLSTALLELNRRRATGAPLTSGLRLLGSLLIRLAKSPLISSIAIGLAWSLAQPPMPEVMDNFVRILAGAAGPCALFAIGASLGNRGIEFTRTVRAILAIKLVAHPALAAVVLYGILRVEPAVAAIGVLAASLPGASNSFIIAQRYGTDTREISASIVAGTFIGLITVSAVIWGLGLRGG